MSRIIVKGLPPRCSEQQLRNFFKGFGTISDCSLKFTKDGKFRRFAFVGFESESDGADAIKRTNQTFLGSYKLQIEECKPFGDDAKPRAWSKYAKDSSAYKRANGEEEKKVMKTPKGKKQENESEESLTKKEKKEVSDDFRNFLEAKGVELEEEKTPVVPMEVGDEERQREELKAMLLESISGDAKLSLILTGLPSSITPKHVKDWIAPVRVKALKVVRDSKSAASFVSFDKAADVRRALQKSGSFLGGFKIIIEKVPEGFSGNGKKDEEDVEEEPGVSREEEEAKVRDSILDSGRLFLRNLPYSTTEDDLKVLMKKYGELADVQVIVAKSTGKCKGFAIVEFVFPEAAVAAYAALDGNVFKGRMLHILPGEEKRPESEENEGMQEKSSFKKMKQTNLKKNAGKAHSWNSLFLGPNAVADSLAEKLGVQKSDILVGEGQGESTAVRLALAETRLVRETRDFLLENGVRLDAFSRPNAKRSTTVILVKNLPAGVEKEELERMFEKFGDLQKVLLPPEGGVSALMVYGNAVDAKQAFQSLAYVRFRTQPLYLEWAPGDVFEGGEEEEKKKEEEEGEREQTETKKRKRELTAEEKKEERKSKKHRKKDEMVKEEEEMDEEVEEKPETTKKEKEEVKGEEEGEEQIKREPENDAVVFVKNLSFETVDSSLEEFFSQRHHIHSAKVSRKFNSVDPSSPLSMGFGFVQFFTREDALDAIKTMQGALLDGHSIELKLSNREMTGEDGKKKRKGVDRTVQGQSTKIMIRNLPFQATVSELESLFTTFGSVKSVRIPKKIGGGSSHRGFGFADFSTKGEAKRAMEALVHSTHLYGRRLVLEWAKGEEESVDELREKTAAKFTGDAKEHRKLKKRMEAIENDLKVADDD